MFALSNKNAKNMYFFLDLIKTFFFVIKNNKNKIHYHYHVDDIQ